MRFLLFNWEDLPEDTLTSDEQIQISSMSDKRFEEIATKYGKVITDIKNFEYHFNNEMISTDTDQLRIIQ